MNIKLNKTFEEGPRYGDGFIWTNEKDPLWLRYKLDLETGVMEGIHATRCKNAIPHITPFSYRFNSPEDGRSFHQQIAFAILADIGKEILIKKQNKPKQVTGMAGQIGEWQNFMSAFDAQKPKKNPAIPKKINTGRTLVLDKDIEMPTHFFNFTGSGSISMLRNEAFQIEERLSGFDAFDIIEKRKGFPEELIFGKMGSPNIDQAKEALSGVERPTADAVAFYGIKNKQKAKIRLQAARSMPILAGLIADRYSLSKAVDEMQPIQPILAEMTGLSKAGLKRIGKLSKPASDSEIFHTGEEIRGEDAIGVNRIRHTRISGHVPVDMAMRYLSELPPDRAPQDNESWSKFNDILSAVAIPIYNMTSIPIVKILEPAKGDWVRFHETLSRAADFKPEEFDRRLMALSVIDSLEMIEDFNRTALLPHALHSIANTGNDMPLVTREFIQLGQDASISLILGQAKNIAANLMEISRRYISRINILREIDSENSPVDLKKKRDLAFSKYPEDGFPVLTNQFHASNGMLIVPLKSFTELADEGKDMRHCVAGYTRKARQTTSHIYSVKDPNTRKRVSTFELNNLKDINPRTAAASLRLVQNQGRCNARPPAKSNEAVGEFLERLQDGDIPINIEEIIRWQKWLKETGQWDKTKKAFNPETTWKSVLELDWEKKETRLQYWDEWKNIIGGRVGKSNDPGVIFIEKKVRDLVGAMSPRAASIMMEQARVKKEEQEAKKRSGSKIEEENIEP